MAAGSNGVTSRIPALALFALFICALLLSLVAGVRVYDTLIVRSDASDAQRFAEGLVSNSIKGLDSYGAVVSGEGPEGPALLLLESTDAGVFETRIYKHDGSVVLEYTMEGAPFEPSKATELVKSDTFGFTLAPGYLSVVTDMGQTDIALRSGGMGVK